ncbi:MAG TPA: anion transporter [Candidatus Methanoperedenaceae archaeon]|nr:anion transporter [Candidatus Methanoperedenaceae archaeon]
MLPLPIIVLFAVFTLTAVRQLLRLRLRIWHIMLGGALAVLLAGEISPSAALSSINMDVMLFLFGMFAVGAALEESGYLASLSWGFFRRAGNVDELLILILFVTGIFSAFIMNDTLAIIGTPLVLHLARKHGISPKLLLLCLAFAVTTGSVMSPIGNPQNLLIAIGGGMQNPFVTFFHYLALPTILNLAIAYLLLRFLYRDGYRNISLNHEQEPIKDRELALLSKVSLILIISLIAAKIAVVSLRPELDFRLTYIALIAALPILVFSGRRWELMRKVDWRTLVFFAAMFIVMESVWDTGFFQGLLEGSGLGIASTGMILAVGILLSQLLSNVPLVALYLPMLAHAGASAKGMVALAAGSTIAGNLLILGAASNVIIIQNAEKRGETLTFFEFAKVGIPLTAINTLVYWIFLL